MGKNDIYVVQRPFVVNGRQLVRRGTRMRGDDVRFVDDDRLMIRADDGMGVEQATAAPGEKRNVAKSDKPEPTKADLIAEAEAKGIDVKSNATKAEIAEALDEA